MGDSSVLVDSSVLIAHFRRPSGSHLLRALEKFDELCVSVITVFEVELGGRIAGRQSDLARVLPGVTVLPVTQGTVECALDIVIELRRRRRSIELKDLFVAATAREHGLPLLTANPAHFQDIGGLKLASV